MRKAAPFIIALIGLAALIIDFWPDLRLPDFTSPDGGSRLVETRLGLDLQGGLRVEYQAVPAGGKSPTPGDMATIKTILENRVNSTGVSEPVVQTQGVDRVVVELPGVRDPDAVERLLGTTGRLDFVPLPADQYGTGTNPGPLSLNEGDPLPEGLPALFSGTQISGANPGQDQLGARAVAFSLHSDGARLFGDYTSKHIDEFFAIVLDGTVVSAPVIQSAITDGNGIITGGQDGFTVAEMNGLITVLRYGSLPFPIAQISKTNISATLGSSFLNQSLLAGAIGIGLVLAFMLIYYRLPGLVADLALVYYAFVVLAIFRFIPVTLTLAGVAGFVLSIGMAVDANILIFERTKEELRLGKRLSAAIEAGFNRAWNSILDSNVSSLITAVILYQFGSSVIRGFALVLIIGVSVSMFSAIIVTRSILRAVVRAESAQRPFLWGLTEEEIAVRPVGRPGPRGEARGRV